VLFRSGRDRFHWTRSPTARKFSRIRFSALAKATSFRAPSRCWWYTSSTANLQTDALRLRWAELFGSEPAARISRDVLIRGVAFRIQEDINGRLSQARRRQLKRLAEELRAGRSIASLENKTFKTGTKLIREWKGRVHEVLITDAGYVWGGKHYRSLTEIARLITGTGWSGPRFFGLETDGRPASPEKAGRASRPRPGSSLTRAAGGSDG